MTTYISVDQIYSRTLREAIESGRSVPNVLHEVRLIRESARQLRAEARVPGIRQPLIGYIPAYGAETEIRALLDYCRLRRMTAKSNYFVEWFADLVASPEQGSDIDLFLGPQRHWQYHEREGEEYMGKPQLEHFRRILNFWKRDLLVRVDRRHLHSKILHKLRGVDSTISSDGETPEPELTQELPLGKPELRLVQKIDDALGRIDQGSYGYCIESGKPIGLERLSARPTESLCGEVRDQRERHDDDEWFHSARK